MQGHWEAPPYNNSSMRSAYHVRALEVHRLMQLQQHVDIFLSHDWPSGIARHGDTPWLLSKKTFLRAEVGTVALREVPVHMGMTIVFNAGR